MQVSLALPSRKLTGEWGSRTIKAVTPQIKADLQVGQRPPGESAQPPAEDQEGGRSLEREGGGGVGPQATPRPAAKHPRLPAHPSSALGDMSIGRFKLFTMEVFADLYIPSRDSIV